MRSRNAVLNILTLVTFTVVTTSVALFTSPLLERWLNPARFGAARLLIDCQGYLTLLELGLGGALSPLLARAFARGDRDALKRSMAVASQAYLGISLATVVVGVLSTFFVLKLGKGLSATDLLDFRTAWLIGLASFLTLGLIPFRTIVEARQHGYRINLMLTVQTLIITGLSLYFAKSGWGITGQSLAQVIGVWVFSIAVTASVLWGDPGLIRSWVTKTDRQTRQSLGTMSAAAFAINLSGRVSLMTDNLVVGPILGTSLVTTLFLTQRLATLVATLLGGISTSIWAQLADLHARGEFENFRRRLVELSRLIAILSMTALAPIVVYNRHFVRLWMGPDFAYGGDLVILIAAINAFLQAQLALWGWCFSGTGQMQKVVVTSVVAAVVNIVASITLTYTFGLVGPLLGTSFSFLTVGIWNFPLLLKKVFGVSLRDLAAAVGGPLAAGVVFALGLAWLTQGHTPRGWAGLMIEMSLAAAVYLGIAATLIALDEHERAIWRLRLRVIFGRG